MQRLNSLQMTLIYFFHSKCRRLVSLSVAGGSSMVLVCCLYRRAVYHCCFVGGVAVQVYNHVSLLTVSFTTSCV